MTNVTEKVCVVCENGYDDGHSCIICKKPCHVFCGEPVEEGYGKPVLCFNCKAKGHTIQANISSATLTTAGKSKHTTEPSLSSTPSLSSQTTGASQLSNQPSSKSKNYFSVMMQSSSKKLGNPSKLKSGHGNTMGSICLLCYEMYKTNPKKIFYFIRFNPSTMNEHMKMHKNINLDHYSKHFVSEEDPKATEAIRAHGNKTRPEAEAPSLILIQKENDDELAAISARARHFEEFPDMQNSEDDNSQQAPESTCSSNAPSPPLLIDEAESQPDSLVTRKRMSASIEEEPVTQTGKPIENLLKLNEPSNYVQAQTPITIFFAKDSNVEEFNVNLNKESLNYIADRISERITKNQYRPSKNPMGESVDSNNQRPSSSCSNLSELLESESQYELISEGEVHFIRCSFCYSYVNNPIASIPRKSSTTPGTSLITGLTISNDDYNLYCSGGCQKWWNFKNRLMHHLSESSQTHINVRQHAREMITVNSRKLTVVRNQLRTAIGIVKSKSAAIHYETRIAELHQAGADVGDFGHSRFLFPQMIAAACAYIDKETQRFLLSSLPSTGIPTHYYATADKSTNHRESNQVTLICPVIDGKRRGIPFGLSRVYSSSDWSGGRGEELAAAIYADLKSHAKVEESHLLYMQGKVTDGQYINAPFTKAMSEPIFDVLKKHCTDEEDLEILLQDIWWQCQWDPGHWLDKVFAKFHHSALVSRLLGRVGMFHQLFRHGKMHSVAEITAKELKLPFHVTLSYAPQRFMSSSYLSLTNLQKSYEAYAETFNDHHNQPNMLYKLCGNDFVFDLCGLIDLLWPMVVLILKAQQEWCPGWKFPAFIKRVRKQLELFQNEIEKARPEKSVSPLLHKHAHDIENFRYGNTKLVEGWILQDNNAEESEAASWAKMVLPRISSG